MRHLRPWFTLEVFSSASVNFHLPGDKSCCNNNNEERRKILFCIHLPSTFEKNFWQEHHNILFLPLQLFMMCSLHSNIASAVNSRFSKRAFRVPGRIHFIILYFQQQFNILRNFPNLHFSLLLLGEQNLLEW